MVRRMLLVLGVVIASSYAGVCALAYLGQRRLLFPAPVVRLPPSGQSVIVEVPGGTHLLWRPVEGGGPVVVHFHGNSEQVADSSWLAEAYAQRGVSFAAVEYPGYPGAQGGPSEEGILSAAELALVHLTTKLGVPRERIVLSGQSLGTGVAVAMATRGWGVRMVLMSPYTSLSDVGARALPWLPVRLFMRDRFEAAEWAPRVRIPVLIIHGSEDEVIPVAFGRVLSKRFPNARFVEVAGAHHNDLWAAAETTREVVAFVAP